MKIKYYNNRSKYYTYYSNVKRKNKPDLHKLWKATQAIGLLAAAYITLYLFLVATGHPY